MSPLQFMVIHKLSTMMMMSVLAGCVQTQHFANGEGTTQSMPLQRVVETRLERAFYREAPNCAIVMPFKKSEAKHYLAQWVENALARRLSGKFDRVIGPKERDRIARYTALDIDQDIQSLSQKVGCRYLLRARPWGGQGVHVMFWSQVRAGMEVELVTIDGSEVLWRARHVAKRSDGGIPFSPFSAIANIYYANRLSSDQEEVRSLIEDAARRIIDTLPDMRGEKPELYTAWTGRK